MRGEAFSTESRGKLPDYGCSFVVPAYWNTTMASTLTSHGETWALSPALSFTEQFVPVSGASEGTCMEVAGVYNGAYEGDNQGQCEMSFAVGDSVVDREYMTTNSICQTLNTYKWGFSSLPLFFFCILTVLYVLALAMLQWEV